jgi:hypothetical protein
MTAQSDTLAAERAVIGAMLARTDSIDTAGEIVTVQDFEDPEMAALFAACIELRAQGAADRNIDHLTVARQARTLRKLSVYDLQEIAESTPVVGNVGYYAKMVKEAATVRAFRDAGVTISAAVEAGHDAETIAQKALNAMQAAQDRAPRLGLVATPYEQLMAQQDAAYDWVVPGFLEHQDRFVLTGVEGLGKSTFLRQAAIMTAAGLSFVTGKPIPPKRALVIDVENSERQWRRTTRAMWQQVHEQHRDFGDRLHVACHGRLNLTRGDHLAAVHRLIDLHQPDLVVIGPLYKLTPKAINSDDDAAPIITALDSIRERGPALMLETHMGHTKGATGDRDVRPRGSAALLGWPEFGAGLAPAKQDDMPIPGLVDLIHWRGMRDARPWPKQLVSGREWPWMPYDLVDEDWESKQ